MRVCCPQLLLARLWVSFGSVVPVMISGQDATAGGKLWPTAQRAGSARADICKATCDVRMWTCLLGSSWQAVHLLGPAAFSPAALELLWKLMLPIPANPGSVWKPGSIPVGAPRGTETPLPPLHGPGRWKNKQALNPARAPKKNDIPGLGKRSIQA